MKPLSEILTNTSNKTTNGTNGFNKLKTNGFNTTDLVIREADSYGVISSDPNYYKWYCRMAYRLGKDKFLALAREAKADAKVDPRKLFSYKLKKCTATGEHTNDKNQKV